MATAAAPPPVLPGMKLGHRLGGGGFADVYLYEQEALARKVAVKVLREHASTIEVQRQFRAESMLMAALSDHQNIVTIYDAAIAPDGRPFLVMAYCPGRNLSERYKSEPLAVAEVLSIGIQLAGAVETAHRQQILHRDIKPANVLTTAAGRPALTDFGISVSTDGASDTGAVGMSIPWSPPEMLADEPTGDRRADVYSLAATLYSLLAGRSPYELPGRSNEQMDLVHRIDNVALTPTGRVDVPASLERVLAKAMAKNPEARYAGALEFARALQQSETELRLPVTPVDISAEDPQAARAELGPTDDGRTRIRPLLTIRAQGPATGPADLGSRPDTSGLDAGPGRTQLRGRSGVGNAVSEHTQMRGAEARPYLQAEYLDPPIPAADTQVRPARPDHHDEPAPPRKSRRPALIGGGAAILLVAVVGGALVVRGTAPAAAPTASASLAPSSIPSLSGDVVPIPARLSGKVQGTGVVFSWADPAPQRGDTYRWTRTDVAGVPDGVYTNKPTATVPGAARACIQVVLIRADSAVSEPAGPICFPES